MNHPIPKQPDVHLKAGNPITTSLAIAEAFGKQHKDVLRAIYNLGCSEEFRQRNFVTAKYRDAQGKSRDMYEVSRDGFLFVGMGFTGFTASAMKEAYINAFNAMEAQLAGPAVRPGQVEALRRERSLPATLTPEQYEAERDRLESMRARLSATPIAIAPEEYERMTAQRLLVGKKTYLVTELIGILEHYGIPREVAEDITGHNRNTIRQHALLSRRRKGGVA